MALLVVPSPQLIVAVNSEIGAFGLASVNVATVTPLIGVPSTPARCGWLRVVSGRSCTTTTAVALLLVESVSVVSVLTVAVLEIEPSSGTRTTNVKVAVAPLARVGIAHEIVPVPPTAGSVHANAGPPVCVSETNSSARRHRVGQLDVLRVARAGVGDGDVVGDVPPSKTGPGSAVLVTWRSARVWTVLDAVAESLAVFGWLLEVLADRLVDRASRPSGPTG